MWKFSPSSLLAFFARHSCKPMTCRPVEWKIQSNSARRPEICNPWSLRQLTRFSPNDNTLAVAKVISTDELLLLFLMWLTLLGSIHRATSNPKANLYTGNAVCEMVVLFLFLPLTCNRGTKTWGCGTYPDSFSCCSSNTVSHFIEAKTGRKRFQKYPAECKKCSTPHFLTRQDNAFQDPHRITLENHREREIVTLPHVTQVPQLGHQMHHREDETAQSHVLHRTNRRDFAQIHIAPLKVSTDLCFLLAPFNWNLGSQETTTFHFALNSKSRIRSIQRLLLFARHRSNVLDTELRTFH